MGRGLDRKGKGETRKGIVGQKRERRNKKKDRWTNNKPFRHI